MNTDDVKAKVVDVLSSEFGISADKIVPEANFRDDLDIDSLDAVDMIVLLEEQTNTKFKTLDLMKIKTVSDLHGLIDDHFKTQG
jgi:acyl carrier protein